MKNDRGERGGTAYHGGRVKTWLVVTSRVRLRAERSAPKGGAERARANQTSPWKVPATQERFLIQAMRWISPAARKVRTDAIPARKLTSAITSCTQAWVETKETFRAVMETAAAPLMAEISAISGGGEKAW